MRFGKGIDNPMYGVRKFGKQNPNWKGEDVGYGALHSWVKRRKEKPRLCEKCKKKPAYDLANISGKYKRDLGDWWWICRHCHMVEDGRMSNLINSGREFTEEIKRKISASCMGRKLTEETKRKIGKASAGRKHTEETKRKISETHKKMPKPWLVGQEVSNTTRRKMSIARKKYWRKRKQLE